jgi:ER membrane protein complex subunit 4
MLAFSFFPLNLIMIEEVRKFSCRCWITEQSSRAQRHWDISRTTCAASLIMSVFNSWKLDLQSKAVNVSKRSHPDPPGYVPTSSLGAIEPLTEAGQATRLLDAPTRARKEAALRQKALDPAKQAGFMCFMLYMSGNKMQVFSIMMLVSCISAPIMAIAKVAKMFPSDEQVDVMIPRLIFCAVQLGQLAFAAYKLDGMGLLPTYPSDWMSQMTAPNAIETSIGPL